MSARLTSAVALTMALSMVPHQGRGQASVSASLHMGLFEGVGVGLAASHWSGGSIYQPGFHVGLGASVGFGLSVGVGVSSFSGYHPDPYGYGGYWHRPYGYGWTAAYSPLHCGWWGYPNPCWDWWNPYWHSGFHFSVGLGWGYYHRPAYFDPWWGYSGYLVRWRPVWVYNPGWWYYNDPWYASPGYARVAYVVPAHRVVRVATPRGGYATTSFKEPPRRTAATPPRIAKPRNGTAAPSPQTRADRPGMAQPGSVRTGNVRSGQISPGARAARPGAVQPTSPVARGTGSGRDPGRPSVSPRPSDRLTRPGNRAAAVGSTSRPTAARAIAPSRSTARSGGEARVTQESRASGISPSGSARSSGRVRTGTSSPRSAAVPGDGRGVTSPSARVSGRNTIRSPSAGIATRGTSARSPAGAASPSAGPSRPSAGTPRPGNLRAPSARAPTGGASRPPTARAPTGSSRIGAQRGGSSARQPTFRAPSRAPAQPNISRSVPRTSPGARAAPRAAPKTRAPARRSSPPVSRRGRGG
jgi:hypothetical protein